MNDARIWRNYAEVLECRLAPTQERIAFLIALKFDFVIEIERVCSTVVVNLDRVIDDQLSWR